MLNIRSSRVFVADSTMPGVVADQFKMDALISWVNAIVRSQDKRLHVSDLEELRSKHILTVLDTLLEPAYPLHISMLPSKRMRLFKYADDFFNGDITHSGDVEYIVLWDESLSDNLEVEWCKFLLLLLAAAVQDESRDKFIFPATRLELYMQVSIMNMMDKILPSRYVPSNMAGIICRQWAPWTSAPSASVTASHREEIKLATQDGKLKRFWIDLLGNKYDGRALPFCSPSKLKYTDSEDDQSNTESDRSSTPEGVN